MSHALNCLPISKITSLIYLDTFFTAVYLLKISIYILKYVENSFGPTILYIISDLLHIAAMYIIEADFVNLVLMACATFCGSFCTQSSIRVVCMILNEMFLSATKVKIIINEHVKTS